MPGIPVSTSQVLDTDVGEIKYYSYVLEGSSSDQNYSCVVSFADYPQEAIALDSSSFLEEFFKSSIEQAASQLRGVVIYSTDIIEGGHPGKLYRIDYGEGLSVKSKVFLVERRFYLVQAFYQRQKEVGHRVDKFVNSFQILLTP
jgi:hypothetical protein